MIGVFIGWLMGLFSSRLGSDAIIASRCRHLLVEIKEELESLVRFMMSPMSSEERIIERLEQIKRMMQQIDIYNSELLFKCNILAKKLDESLPLFYKYRLLDQNAAHEPHAIAASITVIWGVDYTLPYRSMAISEMQNFFRLSQTRRFWFCVKNKLSKSPESGC